MTPGTDTINNTTDAYKSVIKVLDAVHQLSDNAEGYRGELGLRDRWLVRKADIDAAVEAYLAVDLARLESLLAGPGDDAPLAEQVRARLERLVAGLAKPLKPHEIRDGGIAIAALSQSLEQLERLDGRALILRGVLEEWLGRVRALVELVGTPPADSRDLAFIYGDAVQVLFDIAEELGVETEHTDAPGIWARAEQQAAELREPRSGDARRVRELELWLGDIVGALDEARGLIPSESTTILRPIVHARAIAAAAADGTTPAPRDAEVRLAWIADAIALTEVPDGQLGERLAHLEAIAKGEVPLPAQQPVSYGGQAPA